MTSRERVLSALRHQEPDRVPIALGGGPYGIVDELYFRLLDLLGLGEPVAPFRSGHNITFMDDRLLDALGTDTRYVWPGLSPSSPAESTSDPDTFLDGFGQPWKRAFPYFYSAKGILEAAKEVGEIESRVHWPDPDDPRWMAGTAERARMLRETTETFVIGRMVTSHGPFQLACSLRGTEQFMMDMALNEEFAHRLIDRIGDVIAGLSRAYVEAAGPWLDLIELPGDDYASNTGPIISPAMFRRFVKPVLARIIAAIRGVRPDLPIMLHSDGQVTRFLPDFIDLGVDVVHPLEPIPGMDHAQVKAEFGSKVCFLGGIDISHAMPGSLEDVRAEVKRRITLLGPGGGYILAPSNHLQADVPPENVVEMVKAARG